MTNVNGHNLELLAGMTIVDGGQYDYIMYRGETIYTSEDGDVFFIGENLEEVSMLKDAKVRIDHILELHEIASQLHAIAVREDKYIDDAMNATSDANTTGVMVRTDHNLMWTDSEYHTMMAKRHEEVMTDNNDLR